MFEKTSSGDFQYLKASATKQTPSPRSGQTKTGYGKNLPTGYMIQLDQGGIWRRVYCVCFSNAGTMYVKIRGKRFCVDTSAMDN